MSKTPTLSDLMKEYYQDPDTVLDTLSDNMKTFFEKAKVDLGLIPGASQPEQEP